MAADKERSLSTWQDLEQSRPLPVKFALYPSQRTNRALCPCLVVERQNIAVIRILDPEHKQPFISLCSIFLLAGKSIPLGLLEFDLHREAGDYDLTLAGLEPREGIWAPLTIATRVAKELGLLPALDTLLDWEIRHIWSLDERDKEGLIHNWRASQLDTASYSTKSLLQDPIRSIHLLARGDLIHTLISQEQREEVLQRPVSIIQPSSSSKGKEAQLHNSGRSRFEQRLIRWSVFAYEALLQSKRILEEENTNSIERKNDENDEDVNDYDDDDARLQDQITFSISSADSLTLLQDLLTSLQADATFSPVSLNANELYGLTFPNTSSSPSSSKKKCRQEIYRDARICITLVHQYWILYHRLNEYFSSADLPSSTKVEPTSVLPSQDEVKERLTRLEETSKRTEWGIAELLAMTKTTTSNSQQKNQRMNHPIMDLTDIRLLLVALLLGIALGAMINRV